jgi:hypothetical protein
VSDAFIPSKKQQTFLRPLNQGIRNDLPSTQMPEGSFKTLEGFIPQPYGLRRRPCTNRYGSWTVDYSPIQGLWTVRSVTGTSFTILMDYRKVYKVTLGAVTPIDWIYEVGTVSGTEGLATITGAGGTLWKTLASYIRPEDRIAITGDTSATNETNEDGTAIKTYLIKSIESDTSLTLYDTLPTGFSPSGATYVIYRSIGNATIAAPVSVDDTLYFTDGNRPLQGVTATAWTAVGTATQTYQPYVCTYFANRMWVADINDPEGEIGTADDRYRQQIRWSALGLGNLTDFSSASGGGSIDLPYGFGAIRRLMPMSQFLVAYFTDGIWLGQPTNLRDLPLEWTKFETGGMGIITPRAVTPFFDGHFFVGRDDVYFMSQRGIEPVGTPVVRDFLASIATTNAVSAVTDYSTSTAIFGVATEGSNINELWRFNWKTKAWSRETRSTTFLSTDTLLENVTWDTLDNNISPDDWSGFSTYGYDAWDDIKTEAAWNQQLFFSSGSELHYYRDDSGTVDSDTGLAPEGIVETGDMDMDKPDLNKIWTELSMELDEPLAATDDTLTIVVTGSVNKGITWKTLGTLSIAAEADEDAINFRLMGPTARFKFTVTQSETHSPYTIGGIGLTYKTLGDETQGRV